MRDGRAPPTGVLAGQVKLGDLRVLLKNPMNRLSQLPDAFAMDDAHAQDFTRLTFGEIIQHEFFHLARLKRMQV